MTPATASVAAERVLGVLLDSAAELRGLQAGRPTGAAGDNPTGDDRIAADRAADQLLVERFADHPDVGAVLSEERGPVVDAGEGLAVAVDPLDGSKNLATGNATGTIVGVYDASLPALGRDLVGAGFVVFGPSTTATLAVGDTVTQYEVEDDEQQVLEADLTLPADPSVVGLGGGDADWPGPVEAVADDLREDLTLRYSGALAADVAQILERGGLYGYPQLRSCPQGKLRHQYEAAPVAYVVEAAGGASTDGRRSVLDRPPAGLHAATPTYVGNEELVERVEALLGDAVGSDPSSIVR